MKKKIEEYDDLKKEIDIEKNEHCNINNKDNTSCLFRISNKKKFDTTDVFLEKKKKFSKFKISHPIDQKINIYEKKKCFKNSMSFLSKFKKNKEIKNFNSNMFLEKLKKKL